MATGINDPSGPSATGTAYSGLTSANYGITSPYVMDVLGKGAAASNVGYTPFKLPGGEGQADSARVANLNPMESNAYSGIASMNWQNPMYQGMGATSSVLGSSFGDQGTAQSFMSPYQQQVVDQQKKAAMQDYARTLPGQSANAFQAGAGRGTRAALLQAEGQRNLQSNLQDIQAKGLQSAYEQGQNQYNQEMNRRLSAGQQAWGMGTDIYGRNIAGGEAQRQQKQAELNAMYEDFQKETGMPKENANYMMQLLGQVPQYQDYSTKAYQTAAPNDPNAAYANALGALGTYAGGGANSGSSATGYGNILSGIMNALGGGSSGSSGSSGTNSSGTDIISKLKQLFGGG